MKHFSGFPSGRVRFVRLPGPFFTDVMPIVEDLAELKVVLYALWHLDQQDSTFRYLSYQDFAYDQVFLKSLDEDPQIALSCLEVALIKACDQQILLASSKIIEEETLFFLNSARGRAALKAYQAGDWSPGEEIRPELDLEVERPNIFRLYEENIGALTPLIADTLREAEQTYPADWIEDAVRTAVRNNVRRWNYIEAILRSWKEEGRHE
jgi:DnaD/phage-associated family protein